MRVNSNRYGSDRGAMIVQMAVSAVAFLALGSLAVDYGIKLIARGQAQTAADAGALAGAISLMIDNPDPVTGPAKTAARLYAQQNKVFGQAPAVDLAQLDVKIMPPDPNTTGATCTAASPCVRVDVYRNNERPNSSLPTFFARLVGITSQGPLGRLSGHLRADRRTTAVFPERRRWHSSG